MANTRDDGKRPNLLERVLGVFAQVHAGEGLTVLLMFLNIFLLLSAYYVLKTVREGLLLGGGGMFGLSGAELKSYAAGMMAFLLIGVVRAYGVLASAVARIRLLNITGAVVIGCLALFFVLGNLGVRLGLAFFLWIGIVNVFLIAQFWSYANDIYTEEQGKRLFAIIAVGGSLGSILGPRVASIGREHTFSLMILAAGMIALCLLLYNTINRQQRRRRSSAGEAPDPQAREHDEGDAPVSKEGGFELVFRQRYLLLIAVMLLVANLVNTTGEFILGATVEQHAIETVPDSAFPGIEDPGAREQEIIEERRAVVTGFYGGFYELVNLLGFLIQAFLVSRIFKYLGVRAALFILPVIALGSYALIGLVGGLALMRIAKIAENSTDYSLQNTVRQALFLPTSRAAKYKAKAAIDTFFVRFGDAVSGGLVALGIHVLSLSPRHFAFANIALVAVWLLITAGIARHHKRLTEGDGGEREAAP